MSYSDNDGWMSAHEAVLREIATERRRQIHKEGWSREHDDEHTDGSLAAAAAVYAHPQSIYTADMLGARGDTPTYSNIRSAWPVSWSWQWWKPKDRRRDLIRAAALIVAEIERLDRASPSQEGKG